MRRRRGSASEQLSQLEEQRGERVADLERQEAEIEAARRQVRESRQAEAAALLDEPDPTAARKSRIDAEARLAELTSNLAAPRRAIDLNDERIEAKREELLLEQRETETAKLRAELSARTEASASLAKKVAEAVDAKRALQATRERARAQQRIVSDLGGDRLDSDEIVWNDAAELAEFLTTSKPLRPVAEHEAYERQRQAREENAPRLERIHWVEQARALADLSWGPGETERKLERFFADVPAALLDDVRDAYQEAREKVKATPRSFARV